MNICRIEIVPKFPTQRDLEGLRRIPGMDAVYVVEKVGVYRIESEEKIDKSILGKVFSDPILNEIHFNDSLKLNDIDYICEVSYRPGVTDNSGLAAREGLKLLGQNAKVASGFLYLVRGDVDRSRFEKVALRHFGNQLIQQVSIYSPKELDALSRFSQVTIPSVNIGHDGTAIEIDLGVSDDELVIMSKNRCLALTLDEMKHIQTYYKTLQRNPTDVELEVLAQTWSEHCKHKIFASKINYNGDRIDSLYKTYIKGTTEKIRKDRSLDWLISVFHDNAGVVRFDDKVDLCIKVETHNSPSALDPYGGAITGILGVNRDILGVGMGGFPIANTNVFCFADPKLRGLPKDLKKPSIIMDGVHQGVEDGGNKSGIPTVNGSFYFDDSYGGKPLVFVGTVGVVPRELSNGKPGSVKGPQAGDYIVMIGGAIGCDGIHGATFSSMELNEDSPVSAVQIGDPLMQKRVTDFLRVAQKRLLYSAITDNGAGGLSSSVGEMATMTGGARVLLERCPVKYPGLGPYELFISESQERMTLAVPPSLWDEFSKLASQIGVDATCIGEFNSSGKLEIFYHDKLVADLDLDFMHDSLPQMELDASWEAPLVKTTSEINESIDINKTTLKLLERLNICSKESYVRRYDHEVGAATVVKPFVGKSGKGPSDSGAIWLGPHGGNMKSSVIVGCGLNPRLSLYDPEIMAKVAVDEAVRNVVAVGGNIDKCCLVDNFCWPDPVKSPTAPDGDYKLGQLVKTCQGMASICEVYGTPLVSGKDSMKNDYRGKDRDGNSITISVLPTLLVTAMAHADTEHLLTSDFKKSGDFIYMVGTHANGLLGSEFHQLAGGNHFLFKVDPEINLSVYRQYYQACQMGLLNSGHDISDGGLLVALCESALGGDLGAKLSFEYDLDLLYGESSGRFVVTVSPDKREKFEALFSDYRLLGVVSDDLKITGGEINLDLEDVSRSWRGGFNVDA